MMKRKLTPEEFKALPKIAECEEELEVLESLEDLISEGVVDAYLDDDG